MSKSPDPSTFEVQQQALALARGSLLESADLGDPQLDQAMGALMRAGVDWGDLYFSEYSGESWVLEDGIVKTASHDRGRGMSARAVSGEKSGFAYSDDLDPATLLRAAKTAGAIARGGRRGRIELRREGASRRLYAAGDPGDGYSDTSKVELLHALDREARAADTRVRQVIASLSIARNLMLVCSSDGRLAADERPLVRLGVTVLLEQNGEVRPRRRRLGRASAAGGPGRSRFGGGIRARGGAPGRCEPGRGAGARRRGNRGAGTGLAGRAPA